MTSRNHDNQTLKRPPANALRVEAWRDLPGERSPAQYRITDDNGRDEIVTLSKGNRIILDALLARPLFCASPVQISDRVCILRHAYSVAITKEMFENDTATDRARFGVYFIGEGVERVTDGEDC